MAAKKATAKKKAKKAPAKKAAAKKKAVKKAAAKKKAPAKKAAAKKKAVKKAPAKKAAAKKKAPAKKAAAKKKAPAKKAAASKSTTPSRSRIVRAVPTDPSLRTIPKSYKYLHDPKWLGQQREFLIRERAQYTSSAERLAAEAAALMADREPGDVQFDEESGEGDTIAVERDRDLALSAAARQSVEEIDSALKRLDAGTYGMCLSGDDFIPRDRLEAIPEASVCVAHKTSMF